MYPTIRDLILKGPFYFGETKMYRLLETEKKPKRHIILTSPLVILSSYCLDRHYLMVNIDHLKSTSCCRNLISFINNLEDELSKHTHLRGIAKVPLVHNWNGNQYLRFNLWQDGINIYDGDKNHVDISCLKKGSLIKIMFWLKGISLNNNNWSLQLDIIQIRIFDLLPPQKCLITSDDLPDKPMDTPINRELIIPEKYQKMLRMGIPKGSVRHKCIIDGVDPSILDGSVTGSVDNNNNNNNNNNKIKNIIKNKNNLPFSTASLLDGINKLSKVKFDPNNKNNNKPKNRNQHVPCLDDILAMKGQLNKTTKNNNLW